MRMSNNFPQKEQNHVQSKFVAHNFTRIIRFLDYCNVIIRLNQLYHDISNMKDIFEKYKYILC